MEVLAETFVGELVAADRKINVGLDPGCVGANKRRFEIILTKVVARRCMLVTKVKKFWKEVEQWERNMDKSYGWDPQ